MFERNGKCKFHAKRWSGAVYVFMDEQCDDAEHHEFTGGQLYRNGSRCQRLYVKRYRYGCDYVEPSSGTDIKFNRDYGIDLYEPNDCITSNWRGNL